MSVKGDLIEAISEYTQALSGLPGSRRLEEDLLAIKREVAQHPDPDRHAVPTTQGETASEDAHQPSGASAGGAPVEVHVHAGGAGAPAHPGPPAWPAKAKIRKVMRQGGPR